MALIYRDNFGRSFGRCPRWSRAESISDYNHDLAATDETLGEIGAADLVALPEGI